VLAKALLFGGEQVTQAIEVLQAFSGQIHCGFAADPGTQENRE